MSRIMVYNLITNTAIVKHMDNLLIQAHGSFTY